MSKITSFLLVRKKLNLEDPIEFNAQKPSLASTYITLSPKLTYRKGPEIR